MRPCTRRIVAAEEVVKAPALTTSSSNTSRPSLRSRAARFRTGAGEARQNGTMAIVEKPRLRGLFHLWAFFVAIVAGVLLIAFADGALPRFAAWVYAMALAAMFGASALYHRYPFKSAARRVWARRLDHSTIFLFIAGTYTPFALLAFNGTITWIVLATVWFGAALGLVLNFVWIDAPKWVSVLAY